MIAAYLFLFPVVITAVSIMLAMRWSMRINVAMDVATGDALKIHKQPVPLVGGAAMAVGIIFGIRFLVFLWGESIMELVLLALAPVFLLGLFDDLRWKHVQQAKPKLKFFWLITCAAVSGILAWQAGVSIRGLGDWLAVAVAIGYAFVFINAVNYQDGMDGLAGTLAFISFIGFLLMGLDVGAFWAALPMIFAGVTVGFLLFNLPPAKVFMGDSGAYLLGMCLAVAAMVSSTLSWSGIIAPLFVVGLPLVDGVVTNVRRLANGKSIFHGDRSHFYDKLMQRGYSARQTLGISAALQTALVGLGLMIYWHA